VLMIRFFGSHEEYDLVDAGIVLRKVNSA
jgi:mRNA-degrading endonuclease HigB of HigAB toxin-antitoxin module